MPAGKDELEKNIYEAIGGTADYHDRDEITTAEIILTWTTSLGKGCSLEEVPLEIWSKMHSVILVISSDNMCGQRALAVYLAMTHHMKDWPALTTITGYGARKIAIMLMRP